MALPKANVLFLGVILFLWCSHEDSPFPSFPADFSNIGL